VVIAEHGDTTTVNGMPRAITEAGLADAVLPIEEIAAAIIEASGA
jgi:chemotaxis response regulator CheB